MPQLRRGLQRPTARWPFAGPGRPGKRAAQRRHQGADASVPAAPAAPAAAKAAAAAAAEPRHKDQQQQPQQLAVPAAAPEALHGPAPASGQPPAHALPAHALPVRHGQEAPASAQLPNVPLRPGLENSRSQVGLRALATRLGRPVGVASRREATCADWSQCPRSSGEQLHAHMCTAKPCWRGARGWPVATAHADLPSGRLAAGRHRCAQTDTRCARSDAAKPADDR
mmetsp:Transcript_20388/g.44421  ORF Transcript_20388/g.44421 Transcript_20388/m.44421 type:complete len:226 (+) Transcript_20388:387-1064(+)